MATVVVVEAVVAGAGGQVGVAPVVGDDKAAAGQEHETCTTAPGLELGLAVTQDRMAGVWIPARM